MATKTPILSLAVFRQSYRMELYHGYLVYIVAMTTLPATIVSLFIACAERATQYISKQSAFHTLQAAARHPPSI